MCSNPMYSAFITLSFGMQTKVGVFVPCLKPVSSYIDKYGKYIFFRKLLVGNTYAGKTQLQTG